MRRKEIRERLEHIRRCAKSVTPVASFGDESAYAGLLGAIQGFSIDLEADPPCACEGRELVLNAGATPVYFRGKTPYINAGCINLGWGAEANPKLKEGESVEVLVLLPALEEEP